MLNASPVADALEDLAAPIELDFQQVVEDRSLWIAAASVDGDASRSHSFAFEIDQPRALYAFVHAAHRADTGFSLGIFDSNGEFAAQRGSDGVMHLGNPGRYTAEISLFGDSDAIRDFRFMYADDLYIESGNVASLRGSLARLDTTDSRLDVSAVGVISGDQSLADADVFSLGSIAAGSEITVTVAVPEFGTAVPVVEIVSGDRVLQDLDDSPSTVRSIAPTNGRYSVHVTYEPIFDGKRYSATGYIPWSAANAEAIATGGHLVAINRAEEQEFLESFGQDLWIGLRREANQAEDSLRWENDEALAFTNWRFEAPGRSGFAVISSGDGKWALESNHRRNPGVIEYDLLPSDPISSQASADGLYFLDISVSDSQGPLVTATDGLPPVGVLGNELITGFTLEFSEDVFSVAWQDAVEVREAGFDGTLGTDDDVDIATEIEECCFVRFVNRPLADGLYELSVAPTIVDRFGNFLGDGEGFDRTFQVKAIGDEYVFEGQSNDTRENATLLTFEYDQNGSGLARTAKPGRGIVSGSADVDFWSFDAVGGSEVVVSVDTSTRLSSDPEISLIREDGLILASSDPHDNFSYGITELPETGRYYIRVSGRSSGEYSLRVDMSESYSIGSHELSPARFGGQRDFDFSVGSNPRTATLAGTSFTSSPSGDSHFELGSLNSGTELQVVAESASWSDLVPRVSVYDSSRNIVRDSIFADGTFQGKIFASDSYYVVVSAAAAAGDDAQFVVTATVNDATAPTITEYIGLPNAAGNLIGVHEVRFSEGIDFDSSASADLRERGADLQFDTADDRIYTVEFSRTGDRNTLRSVIKDGPLGDGHYRIGNLTGISDLSGNALDPSAVQDYFFTVSGVDRSYVIESPGNDSIDTATVLPLQIDSSGTGLLRSEKPGIGHLQDGMDVDWWSFEAIAGDRVIAVDQSNSATLRLTDSQGESLRYGVNSAGALMSWFEIPVDGTYYVRVSKSGETFDPLWASATYKVRVDVARNLDLMGSRRNSNEVVELEPVPESGGKVQGSIAGTLRPNSDATIGFGVLDANVRLEVSLDLPEWSKLKPEVVVSYSGGQTNDVLAFENGVAVFETTAAASHRMLIRHGESVEDLGFDGQFVVTISMQSLLPFEIEQVSGLPESGGSTDQRIADFELTFSQRLDRSTAVAEAFTLTNAGRDNEFGTLDDREINLELDVKGGIGPDTVRFHQADIFGFLPEGAYQLTVQTILRSEFNEPLHVIEVVVSEFSIDPLPEIYLFEPPINDASYDAVKLDVRPEDSNWHRPGMGTIDSLDDVDWWRFDATAGELVTIWTPIRDERFASSFEVTLQDRFGNQVEHTPNDSSRRGQFHQFIVPGNGDDGDGELFVSLRASGNQFLSHDGLYELWIRRTQPKQSITTEQLAEFSELAFVDDFDGHTAVSAEDIRYGGGGHSKHDFSLGDAPTGANLRAIVHSPHWAYRIPHISLIRPNGSPAVGNSPSPFETASFLKDVGEYRLRVETDVEYENVKDWPGIGSNVDFLVESTYLDPVPVQLISADGPGESSRFVPLESLTFIFDQPVNATSVLTSSTIVRDGIEIGARGTALGFDGGAVTIAGLSRDTVEGGYLFSLDLSGIRGQNTGAPGVGTIEFNWTVDQTPPRASVADVVDGDERRLTVEAVDASEVTDHTSGVAGISLFKIDSGVISHERSDVTGTTRWSHNVVPDANASYMAVAQDHADNRSGFVLPANTHEIFALDSSIASIADVVLPSVVVVDESSSLRLTGHWSVHPPAVSDGQWVHVVSAHGQTLSIKNSILVQNPADPYDVDRSGNVTAKDALLLINYLERIQGSDSNATDHVAPVHSYYFDVSGDNQYSATDALQVINYLHRRSLGSGESEKKTEIDAGAVAIPMAPAVAEGGENKHLRSEGHPVYSSKQGNRHISSFAEVESHRSHREESGLSSDPYPIDQLMREVDSFVLFSIE